MEWSRRRARCPLEIREDCSGNSTTHGAAIGLSHGALHVSSTRLLTAGDRCCRGIGQARDCSQGKGDLGCISRMKAFPGNMNDRGRWTGETHLHGPLLGRLRSFPLGIREEPQGIDINTLLGLILCGCVTTPASVAEPVAGGRGSAEFLLGLPFFALRTKLVTEFVPQEDLTSARAPTKKGAGWDRSGHALSEGISMMLSTDVGVPLRRPGRLWPGTREVFLARPAGVGLPVFLRQTGGCGGEVVGAVGLAGVPVEEHLGGDRFEADVLGPEPVGRGVAFDVGCRSRTVPRSRRGCGRRRR